MSEKPGKPVKRLQLSTEIDASPEAVWRAITEGEQIANWFAPEASTKGTGVGSEVTFGWSEEMRWTTKVNAWEPGKRVRWLDDPSMMGEGTAMASEWLIESVGGKTRLTLVQSAFGESDAWDDLFDGTEKGWTYFMYHLRVYLETLKGKKRHMISSRFPVSAPRDDAWRKLLSPGGGLLTAGTGAPRVGDRVQVKLGDAAPIPAIVELAIPGRIIALRMPEQDAILFLEFEMGKETFHVGAWLSVHDAGHAARMEAPAMQSFDRARAAFA